MIINFETQLMVHKILSFTDLFSQGYLWGLKKKTKNKFYIHEGKRTLGGHKSDLLLHSLSLTVCCFSLALFFSPFRVESTNTQTTKLVMRQKVLFPPGFILRDIIKKNIILLYNNNNIFSENFTWGEENICRPYHYIAVTHFSNHKLFTKYRKWRFVLKLTKKKCQVN